MTGPTAVTPTEQKPKYDLTLSDGTDSVGLIAGIVNRDGNFQPNIEQLSRTPANRTAIQTNQGTSKYSSLNPPWGEFVQDDWTGGRGSNDFERDTTRFYDSSRVIPGSSGLVLGPIEHFSYPGREYYMVDKSPFCGSFYEVLGTQYLSISFSPDTSDSYGDFFVVIKGSAADITNAYQVKLAVYSDTAGDPNALLSSANATIVQQGANVLRFVGLNVALTAGTTYHIVLSSNSTQTFYVGYNATGTGNAHLKTGAGVWGAVADTYPWFAFNQAVYDVPTRFFEYKRGWYAIQQVTPIGNSFLYRVGFRGAADSNAGNLDRLVDATQTFTSVVTDGIVLITKGPGSEEETPWRDITGYDTGAGAYVTVSPSWKIAHTTETEYVIIRCNVWSAGIDLGGIVSDVAVAGEHVYFARGDDTTVARYNEYNNAGTWTARAVTNEDSDVTATHLVAIQHPDDGMVLYGARNDHAFFGVTMWKAWVPRHWGPLYYKLLTLDENNKPWDDAEISAVTQSTDGVHTKITVGAGAGAEVVAIHTLDAAVDLTQGDKLVFPIYSDVVTDATNMDLLISDLEKPLYDEPQIVHWDGTNFRRFENMADASQTYFTDFTWQTTHRLYVGAASRFQALKVIMGTTVNAVASDLSATYWDGTGWVALSITDTTDVTATKTLSGNGDITWTIPGDWEPGLDDITDEASFPADATETFFWIRLLVSVNLTADIEIKYMLANYGRYDTLSLPALAANTWTWFELDISPVNTPALDYTNIKSLTLYLAADLGAQDIYLGPMYLKNAKVKFIDFPDGAKINKIWQYDGNQSDPRTNPWVITENQPYEIQTQNGDALVPIPIQEIAAFASSENGRAVTVNDVYLYFNLGGKVERYFGRNLDDIGPDLDEGMPSNRQGTPIAAVSYPGQVFFAFDGGASRYSTVMVLRGQSWYELYRAPATGLRITDMGIQSLPGKPGDLLWVALGQDQMYFYISPSPVQDSNFEHAMAGYLESGWFYGGQIIQNKVWKSLGVHMDSDTSTVQTVYGTYRTGQYAAWTAFGTFDTVPYESIDLAANFVNSTRIKYRLDLTTVTSTRTPIVKAAVFAAFSVIPVKYGWRFQALLSEAYADTDLLAVPSLSLGYTERAETALAKLDAWAEGATVLTMTGILSPMDSKKVILSAVPYRPIKVDPDAQIEKHLIQIEVNGV